MAFDPSVAGQVARNERSARALLGGVFAAVALVVLLVVGLATAWWIGVLVALVVAGGSTWLAWRRWDPGVVRALGAVPADAEGQARLHNLVTGLCVTAGVPKPDLYVIEADAANALVAARNPKRSALVVTTGLLTLLNRVELEGVLAHQISRIETGEAGLATLAATLLRGWRWPLDPVEGAEQVQLADLAGVALTRYPPGLLAALEKLAVAPTGVATPPALAHLFLVSPLSDGQAAGLPPLDQRVAALEEL